MQDGRSPDGPEGRDGTAGLREKSGSHTGAQGTGCYEEWKLIQATGSAGLINTIAMLSQGHILAGVFGVISSVGWLFQAIGGGLLYKKVWDYKNNNADITFAQVSRVTLLRYPSRAYRSRGDTA